MAPRKAPPKLPPSAFQAPAAAARRTTPALVVDAASEAKEAGALRIAASERTDYRAALEECRRRGIVLEVVADDAAELDRLASEVPELDSAFVLIVATRAGATVAETAELHRALFALALYPDVAVRFSTGPSSKKQVKLSLEPVLEAFGTHRVMWAKGDDEAGHELVLACLTELGVSDEALDDVFAGNAQSRYRYLCSADRLHSPRPPQARLSSSSNPSRTRAIMAEGPTLKLTEPLESAPTSPARHTRLSPGLRVPSARPARPTPLDDRGDVGLRPMSPDEDESLVAKGKQRAVDVEDEEEEEEEEEDDPNAEARIQEHLKRLADAERARRRTVRSSGQFVFVPTADVDLPALGNGISDLGRRGSQLARRGSRLAREASHRNRARRLASQGAAPGMNPPEESLEMSPTPSSPTLVDSPTRPAPLRAPSFETVTSETYQDAPETQPPPPPPPSPPRQWKRLSSSTRSENRPSVSLFDWCLCACFVVDDEDEQAGKTMPDL